MPTPRPARLHISPRVSRQDARLRHTLQSVADCMCQVHQLPQIIVSILTRGYRADGYCDCVDAIRVRVRAGYYNGGKRYPMDYIINTLAHELAHMRFRNHDAKHERFTMTIEAAITDLFPELL